MAQTQRIGTTATTVSTEGGWTRVVYHQTTVVKWNAEKIILDTGGWKTVTTKTRMNQAANQYDLGFLVYQKDFNWFVCFPPDWGLSVEFIGQTLVIDRKTMEVIA